MNEVNFLGRGEFNTENEVPIEDHPAMDAFLKGDFIKLKEELYVKHSKMPGRSYPVCGKG